MCSSDLIEDFEAIASQIGEKIKRDFIYVLFSSGGGTRSGASPMLIDLLIQHMDKEVGAITIIPSSKEPLKTHINAYECFRELEEIEGMGSTIVLDNNACDNKLSINKDFVEHLEKMLEMPSHKDIRGNIDKAEVSELLRTRGMMVITKTDKEDTSEASVIEGLKKNIYAPIEDDKVIKYVGILTARPVELTELKKEYGNYVDVFQGYADETVCVLTGLSLPFGRLEEIKQIVMDNQEAVKRNLQATATTKLDQGIDFLGNSSMSTPKKHAAGGKTDLFAKYRKK